jgi:hypothetical protein
MPILRVGLVVTILTPPGSVWIPPAVIIDTIHTL